MFTSQNQSQQKLATTDWQQRFLELLPEIRRHASFAFRTLRTEAKEDAIAEAIANAFVAFTRLVDKNHSEKAHPSVLARFAARQIRSGRRVGMSLNCNDVLSRAAQLKHQLHIESIEDRNARNGAWSELTLEDRQTPVPDQAAFRCDFPAWLNTLTVHQRRIAEKLSAGETTGEVAEQFQISPGRVSQLRRELADSWREFHEEEGNCNQEAVATIE
jgi:hypothetical protein